MNDIREQAALDELKRWTFGEYPYDLEAMMLRCLKAADQASLMTKVQVIHRAHELEMHKHVMLEHCELCFNENFLDYTSKCRAIILAVQTANADGIAALESYFESMRSSIEKSETYGEPDQYPMMCFHEHPVYLVCNFLGIEIDSLECDEIANKTRHIWD